jgi:type III secretory pathway lipoprotein EscJ
VNHPDGWDFVIRRLNEEKAKIDEAIKQRLDRMRTDLYIDHLEQQSLQITKAIAILNKHNNPNREGCE